MNSEAVYEIYVDVLYGNCVVMNYLILTVTGVFLGRSATRLRKILISMLCAGINLCCILVLGIPAGLRTILGYGICEILGLVLVYRIRESDEMLRGVICMYLLTFLYGGCLSFLKDRIPYLGQHGYTMPILLGVGCLGSEMICRIHKKLKSDRKCREQLYEVRFLWEKNAYSCTALYDTGNRLYEPLTKCPVCIIEQSVLGVSESRYEAAIPYHSVGCRSGMLYGVYVEAFCICRGNDKERIQGNDIIQRVLLAIYPGKLSAKGEYQMILHPELLVTEREI